MPGKICKIQLIAVQTIKVEGIYYCVYAKELKHFHSLSKMNNWNVITKKDTKLCFPSST